MWTLITAAFAQPIPFGAVGQASADLDGDGRKEVVVAGFTKNKSLIARVTSGTGTVSFLDLGSRSDIMGARDVVELSITPSSETGTPFIKLFVPGGEYCGSGDTTIYVSYTPSNEKEPLKNALEVGDFFDAPIWSRVQTHFDLENRTVKIDSSYGGDGKTESASEVLHFVDGVFAKPEEN